MNGLGLYCPSGMNSVDLFDAMLRDTLSVEQYISTKYTPLDFEERDIEVQDLQFFNPTLHKPPSSSWSDKQITPESIARSSNKSMYRTLIYKDSQIQTACRGHPAAMTGGLSKCLEYFFQPANLTSPRWII